MTDRELSDFPSWFLNDTNRLDRERAMERSGIPLEQRTKRVFRDMNYHVTRHYYVEDGVSHELDFKASNLLEEVDFTATEIEDIFMRDGIISPEQVALPE
jgi:hypothetical protein